MQENKCFINVLKKLKISSKEAIEGIGNINKFNEYMHVPRTIDGEFEDLIYQAANEEKSQLILVCGSAGDGKSHLISYFMKNNPDIKDKFILYNDATESFSPTKTSMQTLRKELEAFSDEKIEASHKKLILAINLGTLTNFIDSEYSSNFSKLKEYVIIKGILDQNILENKFDENSYFQYINFTDYKMYCLTKNGPESHYMLKLIKKIVDEVINNEIYNEYRNKCCNSCISADRCPIKENYENLMNEKIQVNIVHKLIEVMIKDKIIISTRALLNFIYDIIVDPYLENLSEEDFEEKIKKLKADEYLKALTVNIMYERKETSNIINALSNIDPLNCRSEEIDMLIVDLNNTQNLKKYFDGYIGNSISHFYYKYIDKTVNEEEKNELERKDIIKFFLRLLSINPNNNYINIFNDYIYKEYMVGLYHCNRKDEEEMQTLLDFVKNGIYQWNGGNLDEEQINLMLGNRQSKFSLWENLKVVGVLPKQNIKKDPLERFTDTIFLEYTVTENEETFKINIDFSLYELLKKVEDGYRLNNRDKNNFVGFMDYVKKLQKYGSHKEKIYFERKVGNKLARYELKINESGKYCLVERKI